MRDHILFGFDTVISLDAKTCSVPQFIGAPQRKFETADLGIKSSVPLAPSGWVNPSHTLVLAMKTIHHSQPPRTKESPRCSKCISRSIFQGTYTSFVPIIICISHTSFLCYYSLCLKDKIYVKSIWLAQPLRIRLF